ncbi:MAG: tryptophan synthase subunit alpha [Firmicutes bacterium]|nr:tryptophan synthase subunit alpha [Bacillota bacterium]
MDRNPLAERIAACLGGGGKLLVTYFTAGHPDLETTVRVVEAAGEAGADCVEIGVPYSDPLADGPVIQAAATRALRGGFRVAWTWEIARRVVRSGVPLAVMTYVNPVLRYGPEAFCRDAAAAGVAGLLVPDLPPEEAGELGRLARRHGLALIPFVAPTSPDHRIRMAVEAGQGFVYCISVTGVTGARPEVSARARELVERVRRYTRLPVLVGFGISTPQQAGEVARFADGVIVGSSLVARVDAAASPEEAVRSVRELVAGLRQALPHPDDTFCRPGRGDTPPGAPTARAPR